MKQGWGGAWTSRGQYHAGRVRRRSQRREEDGGQTDRTRSQSDRRQRTAAVEHDAGRGPATVAARPRGGAGHRWLVRARRAAWSGRRVGPQPRPADALLPGQGVVRADARHRPADRRDPGLPPSRGVSRPVSPDLHADGPGASPDDAAPDRLPRSEPDPRALLRSAARHVAAGPGPDRRALRRGPDVRAPRLARRDAGGPGARADRGLLLRRHRQRRRAGGAQPRVARGWFERRPAQGVHASRR